MSSRMTGRFAAVLTAALSMAQPAYSAASDDAVRDYMLCARRNAAILEPSDDPPQDVARAAVFLCQSEEATLFRQDAGRAVQLRETALLYAASQAVIARACRKANRCGLAPL